ncbi:MAG: outer membrane lipoprotein carrier protein LolA [Prevotellaceae bacterium]|jgi:outer membrane lipoprotein-sorting protein|nr:outer membrane lipoprotein carrier protein LolA [Prevotellaceae bacterium]
MNLIKLATVLFWFLLCAYGQEDSRSQKILHDLSEKFKTYPGVEIKFSVAAKQFYSDSESTYTGSIWLKGNMYKFVTEDYIIYFDGSKIYQYMPEVNEVNVALPETGTENEDFQLMNPQTFFTFSSKNFKSNLVKESTQNGRKVYEIDLYPVQIKDSQYSRVKLYIENSSLQIAGLNAFMKDGTQYRLSFEKYKVLQTLSDSFFKFNAKEYPGVEIIDLTF